MTPFNSSQFINGFVTDQQRGHIANESHAMAQKSNIRVYVRFKDEAFFAGEDVECMITFENVLPRESSHRKPDVPEANGYPKRRTSLASQLPQSPKTPTPRKPSNIAAERMSRQSSADGPRSPLNVVDAANKEQSQDGGVHIATSNQRPQKHRRSVSIISGAPQRPRRKHGRSLTQQSGSNLSLRRLSKGS